jgi:hypothetical protein
LSKFPISLRTILLANMLLGRAGARRVSKNVYVAGVTGWECFVWSSGVVEELQIPRSARDDKSTDRR